MDLEPLKKIANQARTHSLTKAEMALLGVLQYLWYNKEDKYVRISNDELSEILGFKREWVSRLFAGLVNKGMIRLEYEASSGGKIRRIYIP